MIKLKTLDILDLDSGLDNLSKLSEKFYDLFNFPFDLSYKMAKIRRKLSEPIKDYKQEHNKLVKELGKINKLTSRYEFGENLELYTERHQILLDSEHEIVDVYPDSFKTSELKKYNIPSNYLFQLYPILQDDLSKEKKIEA